MQVVVMHFSVGAQLKGKIQSFGTCQPIYVKTFFCLHLDLKEKIF